MTANRAPRARLLVPVVAVAMALVAGGCSGDEQPDPRPSEPVSEPSEAPTLTIEPVTSSGKVVGRLPRKDRRQVQRSVSGVAVRWLEAAYLRDDYPRRDFRNSFGTFTAGARAAARHDLDRMTNARIGGRIEGVVPTRVGVRVDLLAVQGRAVSATAHVDTRFRTRGDMRRTFRVAGRLMMTRVHRRWRVFAYDMARVRVDARPHAGKEKHAKQAKKAKKAQKGDRA